jgi:predicted RNA-binding protein YlxR (DUF448 family)
VRIVRSPQGDVAIDPTGRAPGRGAYLCGGAACWDLAGPRRALEHALKTRIPDELIAALAAGPAALATTKPPTRVVDASTGTTDVHPDMNEGGPHGTK